LDLKSVEMLIEKMRADIIKSYESSAFIDEAVIKKSQKLDALLNQYDRLIKSKQNNPGSCYRLTEGKHNLR
jgi:hypothetical protein